MQSGCAVRRADHVELFLLQLYSEMAHACTRGTWTCFESRGLPNDTPNGGYTTPSQSIVPLHLKWLLVWEEPLARAVTLCRACPRAWLGDGERIAVRDAPTALGRISFNISSKLGATIPVITAAIQVIGMAGGQPRRRMPNKQPAIAVRLRAPVGWHMESVSLDGLDWQDFDPKKETVTLPLPPAPLGTQHTGGTVADTQRFHMVATMSR